jgi:L-threonylcarbamoyladenylate synthase
MTRILEPADLHEIALRLRRGEVGVLRTDTLYGIVADAHSAEAVERLYRVRGRDADKPVVVLIADESQIWDSRITADHRQLIHRYWPGPISIILPAGNATAHIHRGYTSIAYRLPANDWLRTLMRLTGPLAAPSANPQGLSPAADIEAAVGYFGEVVDFYVDQGRVENATPSQLLRVEADGSVLRLR